MYFFIKIKVKNEKSRIISKMIFDKMLQSDHTKELDNSN